MNPLPNSLLTTEIAIAWSGLPPYAIACVGAFARQTGRRVHLIGTAPDTPYQVIEPPQGVAISWVDPHDDALRWGRFGSAAPACFVVSGWTIPAFNALARDSRKSGGSVVLMMDNRWRGDLRQRLAPLVFRTVYCRRFDAALVPGRSAREYAIRLGFHPDSISTGLYGADPAVFTPGPPLAERPKRFLYVGRIDRRKGISELMQAWKAVCSQLPEWDLHLMGCGPLRESLPALPRLTVCDFLQPGELAPAYRESRFLVLPSHEDHWGLVVHEAALSGCGLVLSKNVGARFDLATDRNARLCPPRSAAGLARALVQAAAIEPPLLVAAQEESLSLASHFGPCRFAEALEAIVTRQIAMVGNAVGRSR
jgi:glycosyltransferase involved in cell wall biosynthesis